MAQFEIDGLPSYSMVIFHGELLVITRGYMYKQHPLDAMFWPWQPVQWPQVLRKAQPSDDCRDGRLESWEVMRSSIKQNGGFLKQTAKRYLDSVGLWHFTVSTCFNHQK